MSGAIDRLEIQAPEHNFWTKELLQAYEQSEPASEALLRMQGGQYRDAVDLRRAGFSSLLFINSRATGSNKLVLDRVGEMSLTEIMSEACVLFEGDVQRLEVKRIDIAVDVTDYSVSWFKKHTSVARKRSGCEFGKLYCDGRSRVETLCYGKRPNLIRIYDKSAQLEVEARRARTHRRVPTAKSSAADGSSRNRGPLTRVERQYGGGRIPDELASLESLRSKAPKIHPFEPLEFSDAAGPCEISPEVGGRPYLQIIGFQYLVHARGYEGTVCELNQRTGGKAKRLIRGLKKHMPVNEHFTVPDLQVLYREALDKQLGSAA